MITKTGIYKMTKSHQYRDSEIGGTLTMPRNAEFLVTRISPDGSQFFSPAVGWQFATFPARFLYPATPGLA